MCHQSPAKLLRSVKRITSFLKKMNNIPVTPKCPSILSFHHLPGIDIPPLPPKLLSCKTLPCTSIAPIIKEKPKLSIRICTTSIPPRPVYHPAIVNASHAMFTKHPSQLLPEELEKFKNYQDYKIRIGEPLETEIIYLPSGGIRTCLNCGELT